MEASPMAFMPHGHCFFWNQKILYLHVISDLLIGLSYFSIPAALVWLIVKRKDLPFNWVFWMFVSFILLCGATHIFAIYTMWVPAYYIQGALKAATAIISMITAFAMWPLIPSALKIPSPVQLEQANKELADLNHNLESRVKEETLKYQSKAEELSVLNAELKRSNQELDNFAYIASHDLKAPLRGIDHLAQWIEEDSGDKLSETSREDLKSLRSRVQGMNGILEGLLSYSRVGRTTQDIRRVSPSEIITKEIELLQIPEGFELKFPESAPSVALSITPFSMVVRNLLSNAIKHHDKGSGKIVIDLEVQDKEMRVTIEDDGPGIASEYHEKIFELFQTIEHKQDIDGSGVGLALVKKCIESQEGRLEIESPVNERGTKFVFYWPLIG